MNFNKKQLITFGVGVSLLLSTVVTVTPVSAAVQVPAEKVFVTQINTGKNSEGNCSPATAKMVLNAYGLGTNITVQDISENYGGLGHGGEVLKKFGLKDIPLNDYTRDVSAKKYLDNGVILTVGIYNGYGPHEGVALDYRETSGYLEYYVLDPSVSLANPYWAKANGNTSEIGNVSITGAWLYNKLEKFSVDMKTKSGDSFKMNLYYDKDSGLFLYSKEDGYKVTGNKNEDYIKASKAFEKKGNDNVFNTTDVIYAIADSFAMINNGSGSDAYFTLSKEYAAKKWGIVK